MNLICNCCMSGYIYQHRNEQIKNPFQWAFITPHDFLTFMQNYKNINFNNILLIPSVEHKNTYILYLDNKVKIKYIHYVYDKNYDLTIDGHNVCSNNIHDWILSTYKRRLARMKDKPIFLYIDGIHANDDNITKLIATQQDVCKIVITYNKDLLTYNSKNTLIIHDTSTRLIINRTYPINYADKYKDDIIKFVESQR